MGEEQEDRTPWICVRISMRHNGKVLQLRDKLGLNSRHEAMGVILDLFVNTFINAWEDGNWKNHKPDDIEEMLGWRGDPGNLYAAFQEIRIMDGMQVRNWLKHQKRSIYSRAYHRGSSPEDNRKPFVKSAPAIEDPNDMRRRTKTVIKK